MNLIGNINAIPFRRFRGGGGVTPFPSIPGITARYSALGLTNEQMAENPVWKDLTGNGHDLQMKNFAWGGMAGVGGYVDNWNSSADWSINNYWVNSHTDHKLQLITASTVVQLKSNNIYNAENVYKNILNVNGLTEAVNKGSVGGLRISATDPITSKAIKTFFFDTDGVIQISFDDVLKDYWVVYFVYGNNTKDIDITIEQLPLYPGALVFDGVDDYGVCDNFPILTKEKGYTVVALRQWITYNPNAISAIATNASDQSFNGAFTFENYNKGAEQTISYGATQISLQYSKSPFSWQTTSKYNGFNIANGNKDATNSLVLGRSYPQRNEFANFAIWELVFLDHDATEEELTKIKDYFVKTYPWLFFDQAWTVTGKTNEDEDRATIANITGNGNNLVLSNFGFAGGSGYGLYGENYNGGRWVQSTDRADLTWTSYSVNITSVKVASTQLYYQSYPEQPSFTVPSYKIKVYGLKDGQTLSYKQVTSEGQQIYKISEDGIYTLPSFLFKANGDWYGFTLDKIQETCDITIEQIPEYEGYLVTDGVDDKAVSKQFKFGENFTVILDFKFPVKKISYCGFDLSSKVRIQNIQGSGVYVVLKGNKTLIPSNVVRAVTSEGKVYDENWNEYNIVPGNISSNYTMVNLGFDGSNQFAESATKLAGIYSSTLSKDECIKAYNYLQTLKAK